nr:MAG TPA: hypothetical protein [Caudoviricetes sp.]
MWITFLIIFQKSLAFSLFMCYNIYIIRNKKYILGGQRYENKI